MEGDKKAAAQEVPIQEQPQFTVTISIANLNELKSLISDIDDKLKQLQQFKLQVKVRE